MNRGEEGGGGVCNFSLCLGQGFGEAPEPNLREDSDKLFKSLMRDISLPIEVAICRMGNRPVTKIRENVKENGKWPHLKTLTSLNMEVRPFFLPSVSSLSDYSIWRP